jgi:hypothetical protein
MQWGKCRAEFGMKTFEKSRKTKTLMKLIRPDGSIPTKTFS